MKDWMVLFIRRLKWISLPVDWSSRSRVVACFTMFFAMTGAGVASGVWSHLGQNHLSSAVASDFSLGFDGGIPWIAFRDASASSKATVMTQNPNTAIWSTVGSAGFTSGAVTQLALVVDHGVPYVAYIDLNNASAVMVMSYHAGSGQWVTLGNGPVATCDSKVIALSVVAGVPFVAYDDGASNHAPTVKLFVDGQWQVAGGGAVWMRATTEVSLSSWNGDVYLAYNDQSTDGKAMVSVLESGYSGWHLFGGSQFSIGAASAMTMWVDASGKYVAYSDAGASGAAYVMRYDSNSRVWSAIGGGPVSPVGVRKVRFAMDAGTPFVAFGDPSTRITGSEIVAMLYDGYRWVPIGNTGDNSFSTGLSFVVSGGIPYYAFQDNGFASVKRYSRSFRPEWTAVGTPGFSAGGAGFSDFMLNGPVPTVVFNNYDAEGSLTAMQYIEGAWSAIGSANFTSERSIYPIIEVIDGVYYVSYGAFDTSTNTYSVKVRAYDGTEWGELPAVPNATGAYLTDLTTDGELLYLAYMDTTWNTGVVRKFDPGGTAWEAVGTSFSGNDRIETPYLAYENGTLFVVYQGNDGIRYKDSHVKTYDPSKGWEDLGTSASPLLPMGLSIDRGVPYVSYVNYPGRSGSVRKYEGESWSMVGSSDFVSGVGWSAGDRLFVSVAGGIPYVTYTDMNNLNRAGAMRFDGTNWVAMGASSPSSKWADMVQVIASGNEVYLCYRDGALGNKMTVKRFGPHSEVIYDANHATSGSVPVDSSRYLPGQAATVLGNTGNLSRANWTFAGWSTVPYGNTGTVHVAGSTLPLGVASVTLYARWTSNGDAEEEE